MDAGTLTSVPRRRQRLGVSALVRRPRLLRRFKTEQVACVRMDPAIRVDPGEIDTERFIEWAEETLTPLELARMKRAAEEDRSAQDVAVC